jgi:hypothetical protein
VVAAAAEPMRLIFLSTEHPNGAWLGGVADLLATTALVMLPIANVVADRQARNRASGGGGQQGRPRPDDHREAK